MTGGGHPVGGQLDVAQGGDIRRRQVGDGLPHRQAPGGGGVDQGQGGALAQGHGLASKAKAVAGGDRHVRHRHLPGAHHLVARHHAGDAAVADGDEESLVRHGRQTQDAQGRFPEVAPGQVQGRLVEGVMPDLPQHARRLAKQQGHGHVDGGVAEVGVPQQQMLLRRGLADHRVGAALPLAERLELLQTFGGDGQDITLLGLVAPDLHG